jgi:hypothetical protein
MPACPARSSHTIQQQIYRNLLRVSRVLSAHHLQCGWDDGLRTDGVRDKILPIEEALLDGSLDDGFTHCLFAMTHRMSTMGHQHVTWPTFVS